MRFALSCTLLLAACATVTSSSYEEMTQCPAAMTEEQHASGVVRCTAMCSSYARDFAEYDSTDCKCRCMPAYGGGYKPQPQKKSPVTDRM